MNDSGPLEFLDTNVLVYAHDVSAGALHEQALALVSRLWASRTGCVSLQVLTEFYVTTTRKIARPLSRETATQVISALSAWRVHVPGIADLLEAIRIHQKYQISLWDALILHSASRLGCSVLWSEDLNAGQVYAEVKVVDPFRQ